MPNEYNYVDTWLDGLNENESEGLSKGIIDYVHRGMIKGEQQ